MSRPNTQRVSTNWTGVSYGIVLGFVAAYFQFKIPPVLPILLNDHNYDKFIAGGFMSIFAIAGMIISVSIGKQITKHGAIKYLGGAFILLMTGSILGLLAPESGTVMLLSRMIEGFGAAVLAVCMPAFANMNAGPRHLPIIIALQATWIPVGQLIANLIAQPAVAIGEWQPVWWTGIFATIAIGTWTLFLIRSNRVDFGSQVEELKNSETIKIQPIKKEEKKKLYLASVLFFLWQAQFMAYFTWLPVYLVDVRDFTADDAVMINQIPVIILLLFALITGLILKSGVGVFPLLVSSLTLQAVSWFLIPIADNLFIGTLSLVAWGIAAGITPTCLWSLPSVLLGGHRADTQAFALVLTGRYLGILAGPLIAVAVYKITENWISAAFTFGGITIICSLATLYLGKLVKSTL
ncbi:MAG: MFS transporter [Alphaproteobacteria bacterium]|nr:MFS transporter [Alphaproteobacteria bacterium]